MNRVDSEVKCRRFYADFHKLQQLLAGRNLLGKIKSEGVAGDLLLRPRLSLNFQANCDSSDQPKSPNGKTKTDLA